MFDCKECDFVAQSRKGLGVHVGYRHGGAAIYYEKHEPRYCLQCKGQIRYKFVCFPYFRTRFCSVECRSALHADKHPLWRGGRYARRDGYVEINLSTLNEEDRRLALPMSRPHGGRNKNQDIRKVFEHRIVAAKTLGRPLAPSETVHHINGKRNDNRPENLEVWVSKHHPGLRAEDVQCPCCNHVFNRFTENAANTSRN